MTEILELDNWYRIQSFMDTRIENARKEGENARTKDWDDFNNSEWGKDLADDADDWGIAQGSWSVYEARTNTHHKDIDPSRAYEIVKDNGAYWEEQMWGQWDRIKKKWDTDWKNHINTPDTMHTKSKAWKKVAEDTKDINTQVAGMAVMNGWQGKGAEAYGKMVPKQVEAVEGTAELVQVSGNTLANGAVGMQVFYLTIAQACVDMKNQIAQVQSKGQWWNMASACEIYRCFADWLEKDVEGRQTNWWDTIKKAQDTLGEHKDLDQKVFKNGKWPESTSEGDISEAEPGPSTAGGGTPSPSTTTPPSTTDPTQDPTTAPPQVDQNQNAANTLGTAEQDGDGGWA